MSETRWVALAGQWVTVGIQEAKTGAVASHTVSTFSESGVPPKRKSCACPIGRDHEEYPIPPYTVITAGEGVSS